MNSVSLVLLPDHDLLTTGHVFYRISNESETRLIDSGVLLKKSEWDTSVNLPANLPPGPRARRVAGMRDLLLFNIERLQRIILRLSAPPRPAPDPGRIVKGYKDYLNRYSLLNYMTEIISSLSREGRLGTAANYRAAFNSFSTFLSSSRLQLAGMHIKTPGELHLDCFSSRLMESYENWLKKRHVAPNTISFYFRILRAIYRRAADRGFIPDTNPFRRVYTGIGRTIKRAIPLKILSRIKNLDLSGRPDLEFARDMFLMSFYLRGMSFVDMAFLRKRDLHNGVLTYRRRKTGRNLSIQWTPEMQRIIERYPHNPTCYLLPLLRRNYSNERAAYRNMAYSINRSLKQIGHLCGLNLPLTLYMARHTWATAARDRGIPIDIISEGMGHESEATTRIYLSSIDTSLVDQANARLIASI